MALVAVAVLVVLMIVDGCKLTGRLCIFQFSDITVERTSAENNVGHTTAALFGT